MCLLGIAYRSLSELKQLCHGLSFPVIVTTNVTMGKGLLSFSVLLDFWVCLFPKLSNVALFPCLKKPPSRKECFISEKNNYEPPSNMYETPFERTFRSSSSSTSKAVFLKRINWLSHDKIFASLKKIYPALRRLFSLVVNSQ